MRSGSCVLNNSCVLHLLWCHEACARRHALKRADVYLLQVHVLLITQVTRLCLQCIKYMSSRVERLKYKSVAMSKASALVHATGTLALAL
jgi:hypothetical protein